MMASEPGVAPTCGKTFDIRLCRGVGWVDEDASRLGKLTAKTGKTQSFARRAQLQNSSVGRFTPGAYSSSCTATMFELGVRRLFHEREEFFPKGKCLGTVGILASPW